MVVLCRGCSLRIGATLDQEQESRGPAQAFRVSYRPRSSCFLLVTSTRASRVEARYWLVPEVEGDTVTGGVAIYHPGRSVRQGDAPVDVYRRLGLSCRQGSAPCFP